VLDKIYIQCIH